MTNKEEQLTIRLKKLLSDSTNYINRDQNKEKTTAVVYAILSLVSISFFGIFAINPTITTIVELKKEQEENKATIQQLETKNKNLSSLGNQYQLIENNLSLLSNAIPNSAKVSQLTRQFEILAKENSLFIEKLDTNLLELYPAKNVNSPVFSYSFTISVVGLQGDIDNFLKKIVRIDRIIQIERVTMASKENTFLLTINGRAFFYKK